jgi:hypothetical protein
MRTRLTKLAATVAAMAALAVGGSAIASAAQHGSAPTPPVASQTQDQSEPADGSQAAESQESTAPESDGDAAAQAAACQKAGIDPNASNVQYDDQSGVCSLDTGSGANN